MLSSFLISILYIFLQWSHNFCGQLVNQTFTIRLGSYVDTVEPPLTNPPMQRTPSNNGQIFSCQVYHHEGWHLITLDNSSQRKITLVWQAFFVYSMSILQVEATSYSTYNLLDFTASTIPQSARYHDNSVVVNMKNT